MLARVLFFALLLMLLTPALPASSRASSVGLRAEFLSAVPLQIGGGLLVELPFRLRVGTEFGFLPKGYVRLSNNVVQLIDPTYSDDEAQLVEDALQKSMVWRLHLGWRPFSETGFVFRLGYTMVTLGGGTSAMALLEGLSGKEIPDKGGAKMTATAGSKLHMVDIELGWEWMLWKGLSLRAGLGWSYTFSSSTEIKVDQDPPTPRAKTVIRSLEKYGEDYLDDTYRSYIHPPTIVLALGWSFP